MTPNTPRDPDPDVRLVEDLLDGRLDPDAERAAQERLAADLSLRRLLAFVVIRRAGEQEAAERAARGRKARGADAAADLNPN